MASNDVRTPALLVLVNGSPVDGVTDVEIGRNAYLSADRFRLTASLAASGPAIWAADVLSIEIRVALDDAWASLITGSADQVEFDLARGEVRVDGRDLTALFIEARIRETFQNQTSSQIATTLALRQGLSPAVTATTTLIGRNFQNDHASISLDQHARVTTEWDLLIRLAELESFDVWVDGQTLNFAPASPSGNVLLLTPQDCKEINLSRALTLSGGLEVTVKSWDCRGQIAVNQTASVAAGGSAKSYVVVRPNLTQQAAQALAQRLLSQMLQQANSVSVEMPGDLTTAPRDVLTLTDTGTAFDGTYMVTEVERQLSFQHGFTQTVQARIPPWTVF